MEKLNFKTNYNVLLWHFVDSLSKWDSYVGSHIYKYYTVSWKLTKEDKDWLKKYSLVRKKLDWEEETNLFKWAFSGFLKNQKFNELKEPVKYFEKRIDKKGQSLKEILKSRLEDTLVAKTLFEKEIKKIDLNKELSKMSAIFNIDKDKEPTSVFLACSMSNNIQGGANGNGLYVEIPYGKSPKENLHVIVHEYLHKKLRPRNFFRNIKNKEMKGFFRRKEKKIYQGELADFFDEVIIHSLSEVIIFKHDPSKIINNYQNSRLKYIWECVGKTTPILENYLYEKIDKITTCKKLFQIFKSFINEKI
jgi:hypothetical protein